MWPTPTFPDDLIISVPLLKSNEKNCDGSLEAGSTGINSDGSTGRNGNFVFYMKKGGAEKMCISKKKKETEVDQWEKIMSTMEDGASIVLRVTTEAVYTKKGNGLRVTDKKILTIEAVNNNQTPQK